MDRSTQGDSSIHAQSHAIRWHRLTIAGLLLAALGVGWVLFVWTATTAPTLPDPASLDSARALESGVSTNMASPALRFGPGWQVDAQGADPAEPANPWEEPSGILTFRYQGRVLHMALAEGDYWGYLYVTVDGEPANQLAQLAENRNSQDEAAGYKTFLAPEAAQDNLSAVRWHAIHRAADEGVHDVRIEVWRSWGQAPLRGLAIDPTGGPGVPAWPGAALMIGGLWLMVVGLVNTTMQRRMPITIQHRWQQAQQSFGQRQAAILAAPGLGVAALGAVLDAWWLTLPGLALAGLASLRRPTLWLAALLFALPFYFSVKLPLLPERAFEIVDVGVTGGLLLLIFTIMVDASARNSGYRYATWIFGLLMAITSWALVAASDAFYVDLALREWRTVFLMPALFGVTLIGLLRYSTEPARDRNLLIAAWLAGATLMAIIACWQFVSDTMLITAEGVRRVRALYGSPNNLALYLERALAVTLSLAIFARVRPDSERQIRPLYWAGAALIQGIALLLTFSKGAIFLALPVMLLTLWGGGFWLLGTWEKSRRMLWWLAGAAVLAGLLLTPFLGTERFQRLLDFESGTGFQRLQLWRSATSMALDHPVTGVGPDNFLYAFRNRYLLPAAWQEPNLNHPHNWLLDWWTRLGFPGLILGVGFWMSGLRTLLRSLMHRNCGQHEQVLALGLLAASLAALAHGLIDVSYALPDLMMVWVLIFFVLPQMPNEAQMAESGEDLGDILCQGDAVHLTGPDGADDAVTVDEKGSR
jgi:O-antigen ligase